MKNGIGTSMGGSLVRTRKPQKGNRRCKDCRHLIYAVRVSKGEVTNYICDVSGKPTPYTRKCYCKRFASK